MKIVFLIGALMIGVSCSSGKRYRMTDYANACVPVKKNELGKAVSDVCVPVDTSLTDANFHYLEGYDKIKMRTLDDAMRFRE